MLRTRIAEYSDLIQLSQFVNLAYRGETSKSGWTTEADLLDGQRTDANSLRAQISGDTQIILLFMSGGKIEACVYLRNEFPNTYLGMLTVNPMAQAKGTGRFAIWFA